MSTTSSGSVAGQFPSGSVDQGKGGIPGGHHAPPRDKSDHVAVLKYAYSCWLAGDFSALRSCMIDKVQIRQPSDENVPKPKPSDIPWVRSADNFNDFINFSAMMMSDLDLNLEISDIFTTTSNPSEAIVVINCRAVGKSTRKTLMFKAIHYFTFNDQHLITKCVGYYDPNVWKEIL